MLLLPENLTLKKGCELLLSPIHQVEGLFCSYEVIGLYPWMKSFQCLLHGRLVGLWSWSASLGEDINPAPVLGIKPQFHRRTAPILVTSLQL
jgi:hypothetical protein